MKNNQNQPKISKRRFLKIAGVLAGIGVIGVPVGISLVKSSLKKHYQQQQIERFGTRENPVYSIVGESGKDSIETYSSQYASIYKKRIEKLDKAISAVHDNPDSISALEKVISDINEEDRIIMNEYDSIRRKNNENTLYKEQEEYGPVIERAKRLFCSMTGKTFPEDVSIEIGNLKIDGGDFDGGYNPVKKILFSKEKSYASTLSELMHEMGHAIESHTKDDLFGDHTRQQRMMSESTAYCFQNAACYFESVKMRDMMLNDFKATRFGNLLLYYTDEKDYHPEAMALCDSAITHFNDPKKAFNYLQRTSYDQLKPEILNLMNQQKDIFLSQLRLKSRVKSILKIK